MIDRPVQGAPGAPPLLLPELPFPPYRFVPGETPHPFAQAGGYAYGQRPENPEFVPGERWRENRAYLRGVDFFNRGWWWEAHEAWEGAWHACEGRDAVQYALLQGLIQLAACALNRERGHDAGAERLLATALEYLEKCGARCCGLDLAHVRQEASARLGKPTSEVEGMYLTPT